MPLSRMTLAGLAITAMATLSPIIASHAQTAHVPEGYESFEAYEIAMFERIDELAAQQGLDISRFYEVRDELRAEYAEAERRNDRAGMAEANALRAHVITRGLEQLSQ